MSNDHFEKRMEFLKKSYDRVPSSFDTEEIFKKIDQEQVPKPMQQKQKNNSGFKQNFTVWAASIASVFILTLIGAGLIYDQKQKSEEQNIENAVTDEYIEGLLHKFEVEREKRREMLMLDGEHFASYSNPNSNYISILRNEGYIENLKQYDNGAQQADEIYEQAIAELKTPSEMIQDLKSNPLKEDVAASIAFIEAYRGKVQRLVAIYDQIIDENKASIEAYEVDTSADKAEVMMLSTKSFPESLQAIINTMKEQSIKLYTGKYSGEVKSAYYMSSEAEMLTEKLHDDTYAYVRMMAEEPYMYAGILQYPIAETVGTLMTMETTLMKVEKDRSLYPVLESHFVTLFNEIVKGSDNTKLFDAEGTLLPEFQEAWTELSFSYEATPIAYIMQPIVKEMRVSGWRTSEQWSRLSYEAVIEALALYRAGVLEEYMYGEQPVFENETVTLPNPSFDEEVKSLYTAYKRSYDKAVLKDVSAVYVAGVFDYANEMEDAETMFYLSNPESTARMYDENYNGVYSRVNEKDLLENYKSKWTKSLSQFRNATSIEFSTETSQRYEDSLVHSLKINDENGMIRTMSMIYGDHDVWEVWDVWLQRVPSMDMSPDMKIDESVQSHAKEVYTYFKKEHNQAELFGQQALTVMGVYLHALDKKDYETQYELYYKGAGLMEKEKYVKETAEDAIPYSEDMYTTMSFQAMDQDSDGNWPGVATLTVDTDIYPEHPEKREFRMFWTEDGWRVKYQPFK